MSHHHVELEEQVLGAILYAGSIDVDIDGDLAHRLLKRAEATGLRGEHFWRETHAVLWRVLARMSDENAPLDPVAVPARIDQMVGERVAELGHVVGWTLDRTALIGRLKALAVLAPPLASIEWRARLIVESAACRAALNEERVG